MAKRAEPRPAAERNQPSLQERHLLRLRRLTGVQTGERHIQRVQPSPCGSHMKRMTKSGYQLGRFHFNFLNVAVGSQCDTCVVLFSLYKRFPYVGEALSLQLRGFHVLIIRLWHFTSKRMGQINAFSLGVLHILIIRLRRETSNACCIAGYSGIYSWGWGQRKQSVFNAESQLWSDS